ncbi:MAG: AAA family ATPase [Kiritimatiellia bacterium]|jgi:type II secretory pathway predicted ATPase ExeA
MRAESSRQKEPALEDLLRARGLLRVPFSPDEKSADTFPSASHREAMAALDTTAALRGVMVLTGSPGTGKSSLLKNWMRTLEHKRYLPLLITQSSLSATGVLEILLAKLGERPRFKRSTNLLTLEKHLGEIEPMTVVLVLDDAQNYPSTALEELRMLLGLGGRTRSAFALILLGDDYLLGSLRLSVQRALFSRISAAYQLQPLPREDITPYLNWHLARAGLEREIFAPAAIDLLSEASEGNPRTLNLLAQAAWLAAARAGASDIEAAHVHAALRQVPVANAKIANP